MRGGTSRGVFFSLRDLPENPSIRDRVILCAFGSPDSRQIDGLGGADPLTSKVAIVSPSKTAGIDVDYTFGYVGIETAHVDYRGNCGNISSAVGPFALNHGWVKAIEPITVVRILNTNTESIIEAHVPVKNGKFNPEGDFAISSVPGCGAKIVLDFLDSGGAVTGKILPTGSPKDRLSIEGVGELPVSIVDAANPFVFVHAGSLGLMEGEWIGKLFEDEGLMIIEKIRSAVAKRIGLVERAEEATRLSPAVPKIAVIAPPKTFSRIKDKNRAADERIDLIAWMTALQKLHKSYAVTGGICTATAACIDGTVVNEILGGSEKHRNITIGHPSGTLEVEAEVIEEGGALSLKKGSIARTARKIMEGKVDIPERVFRSFAGEKNL